MHDNLFKLIVVVQMPRRKTYLIGFLAEAICLAARTMNWGLALGIMRSTIELRNARIMPSGEPGIALNK